VLRSVLMAILVSSSAWTMASGVAPPGPNDPARQLAEAAIRHSSAKREYDRFRRKLLLLVGRWERGTAREKEKARLLRQALKLARDQEVEPRFEQIAEALSDMRPPKHLDKLLEITQTSGSLRKTFGKMIPLVSKVEELKTGLERIAKAEEEVQSVTRNLARQCFREMEREAMLLRPNGE
jgi:hypothetical protein